MDVVCPRCESRHRVDPPAGARNRTPRFRCSRCGHVFRIDLDVPGAGAAEPPRRTPAPEPHAAPGYARARIAGELYPLTDAAELQRWILEGRVGPDDEVEAEPDAWLRVADRPELALFLRAAASMQREAAGVPAEDTQESAVAALPVKLAATAAEPPVEGELDEAPLDGRPAVPPVDPIGDLGVLPPELDATVHGQLVDESASAQPDAASPDEPVQDAAPTPDLDAEGAEDAASTLEAGADDEEPEAEENPGGELPHDAEHDADHVVEEEPLHQVPDGEVDGVGADEPMDEEPVDEPDTTTRLDDDEGDIVHVPAASADVDVTTIERDGFAAPPPVGAAEDFESRTDVREPPPDSILIDPEPTRTDARPKRQVAHLPPSPSPRSELDDQFFQAVVQPPRSRTEPPPPTWPDDEPPPERAWLGPVLLGLGVLAAIASAVWVFWPTTPATAPATETVAGASTPAAGKPDTTAGTPATPDKTAADKTAADKTAADKAAADKVAADKVAADKAAADKAAADKAAADKAAADKAAADKAAKAAAEKAGDDAPVRVEAKKEPTTAKELTAAGWSALDGGDAQRAQGYFDKAHQKNPGDAMALYGRGYATEQLGDRVSARMDYCDAKARSPGTELARELDAGLKRVGGDCP